MDGDVERLVVGREKQMFGCHVFCAGLGWHGMGRFDGGVASWAGKPCKEDASALSIDFHKAG